MALDASYRSPKLAIRCLKADVISRELYSALTLLKRQRAEADTPHQLSNLGVAEEILQVVSREPFSNQ